MDFPTFLLVIFGLLSLLAALLFLTWRHPRAGSAMQTPTSFLHQDLTAGRYGPFWSFVTSAARRIGSGVWIVCLGLILFDRFGNGHPKPLAFDYLKLGGKLPKPLGELRDPYLVRATPSSNASDQGQTLFGDLDHELADRAQEVAAQSSRTSKWASLREDKQQFLKCYGEPFTVHEKGPTLTAMGFHHENFTFAAWFWNGSAHEIDLIRRDGARLTDQDVRQVLGAFGGSGEWVETTKSADGRSVEWNQDGACAFLNESAITPSANDPAPVDMLKIYTDEFMHDVEKREGHGEANR